MPHSGEMLVQVCYQGASGLISLTVNIAQGSTLSEAIQLSGILQLSPDINLKTQKVGVFGKLKSLDAVLHAHDRIEIYRPLLADPMEARRRRAAKQKP